MQTKIDLSSFGVPSEFTCRGTVQDHRTNGQRLLFLFAERHSIRPGIREHLLNALELDRLGALACVGVEGCPGDDFPGHEVKHKFTNLQAIHDGDEEAIIDGMLDQLPQNLFFLFWRILHLLRVPSLTIATVDDEHLCGEAANWDLFCYQHRIAAIQTFLQKSSVFKPPPLGPSKECWALAKAMMQGDHETAEKKFNVDRDDTLITNMLALWDRSGPKKVAILNAGASHQYRIARRLASEPGYSDLAYYLIEQP